MKIIRATALGSVVLGQVTCTCCQSVLELQVADIELVAETTSFTCPVCASKQPCDCEISVVRQYQRNQLAAESEREEELARSRARIERQMINDK